MVELNLDIQKQNIQVLQDIYNESDCKTKAQLNKSKAFGMFDGLKSVFDKSSFIELVHSEKRYEPFWHITGESYVEYLRGNRYTFEVDPQVRSVKIAGKVFNVEGDNPKLVFDAEDRCVEHNTKELLTDAVEGKQKAKDLKKYLESEAKTKMIKQTEDIMGKNKVVVPAKIKASFLIRDFLKTLIQAVNADKILQESVEIKKLCLYFRPVYAFEFKNSNGKTGALEVDAITGEMAKGKVYKRELAELIPEGALFDIGAEIASMVIPGAALGAEIGKAIKKKHDQSKKKKAMQVSKDAEKAKKKK